MEDDADGRPFVVPALRRDAPPPSARPHAQSRRLDAARAGKENQHGHVARLPFPPCPRDAPYRPSLRYREDAGAGAPILAAQDLIVHLRCSVAVVAVVFLACTKSKRNFIIYIYIIKHICVCV